MLTIDNPPPSLAQAIRAISPPLLIVIGGAAVIPVHAGIGALIFAFGAADAYGRWKDYHYLSRQEYLTVRLAVFYGRSFCGRVMVGAINPVWKHFYYSSGYRWWHILPDGFPGLLLKPSFWRTLVAGHRH